MNGLSLAQALAPGHWPVLVLVSGRIVGLMLAAPLWAMAGIPRSVRSAVAVMLTLVVLPGVPATPVPAEYLGLLLPIASELLLGLAIGLVGAVFLAGVNLAGEVAALQMGLNLGPSLSPLAEASVTGVGELENQLALVIYATLGGHLVLLGSVAGSFQAIAPGGGMVVAGGSRAVLELAGTVFSVAVRVAAPMMVALLLANVALAILSRAVPQLNAMAVAFPITIGLGFLVLGAALPFSGGYVAEWVGTLPASAARVVGAFTPAGAR